jgi:hypothetical protein
MSTGLGREDIRALLDELSAELSARGTRAELFLVGGAAMAVAYDATRATRDLDAVFVPTDVVRQAAAAVAEREGLAEDWLNDAVKGFLPGPDPDAAVLLQRLAHCRCRIPEIPAGDEAVRRARRNRRR